MAILLIVIFLFILYSILIFYYWRNWISIPRFTADNKIPELKISVIIPARNEEENISRLLHALEQQTFPKELFEIIVIDDHSTDSTAAITRSFKNVSLIQLQDTGLNAYKKKAIEKGIAAATGELIVTTDADCLPGESWLQTIAAFKEEKKAGFIAAPVSFHCNSSVLQVFQAMDFMVLQGITGAAVHSRMHAMCNGANIAYERKLFNDVNGFEGIDQIASGDDMLLMHKIWQKDREKVQYLKSQDAITGTLPMQNWKAFLNQRIRWASKATKYNDKRVFWILLLVYLFNLSFLVLFIAGFWEYHYWLYLLLFWMVKTLVELPFFVSLCKFFHKQWAIPYFFLFQPFHILYTIFAGLLGQFGKYEWKGRRVR